MRAYLAWLVPQPVADEGVDHAVPVGKGFCANGREIARFSHHSLDCARRRVKGDGKGVPHARFNGADHFPAVRLPDGELVGGQGEIDGGGLNHPAPKIEATGPGLSRLSQGSKINRQVHGLVGLFAHGPGQNHADPIIGHTGGHAHALLAGRMDMRERALSLGRDRVGSHSQPGFVRWFSSSLGFKTKVRAAGPFRAIHCSPLALQQFHPGPCGGNFCGLLFVQSFCFRWGNQWGQVGWLLVFLASGEADQAALEYAVHGVIIPNAHRVILVVMAAGAPEA